jgi:hypothetical protein
MTKNIFSLRSIANMFNLVGFAAVEDTPGGPADTAPAKTPVPPIEVPPGMVASAVKFNFKQRTIKGDGTPANPDKKLRKQPSVTANIPNFTGDYLVALFSDDSEDTSKARALVLDYANEIFREQAKSQFEDVIEGFGEDETQTVSAASLNYDKLTLEFIANLPPAQRGRQAISDEEWNLFYKDYLAVMLKVTGKDAVRINKHVDIFKKPTRVKSQPDVMAVMVDQLDIYIAHSELIEDTAAAAKRMRDKFDAWLKEEKATYDVSGL